MIKDISSEAEPTNVPELEPEDAVIPPPATPGTVYFQHDRGEESKKLQIRRSRMNRKRHRKKYTEEVSEEVPDVVIESEETDAEEAEELPEAEEEPEIEG